MDTNIKTTKIIFCCVDLETLGTGQNAFVYQAGMASVEYTLGSNGLNTVWAETDRQYAYWDWLQPYKTLTEAQMRQIESGAVDPDTLAFHMKGRITPDSWKAHACSSLYTFANLLPGPGIRGAKGTKVFYVGQNIEFDWPKLVKALGPAHRDLYTFRNTIDLRTLENIRLIAGVKDKSHIAIEDAVQELKIFTDLWDSGNINLNIVE